MKSLNLNAPRRRHISFVSVILFLVVIALLALGFFEVFRIRDESNSNEDEIKSLTEENEKYQNQIKELEQKNKELESAPAEVGGFYSANSTPYYEILLSEGIVVLSTENSGTRNCFYGTYTVDGNTVNMSFTTGLDSYNNTVTVPQTPTITVNEDNTLVYSDAEGAQVTLSQTSSNDIRLIGKIFNININ